MKIILNNREEFFEKDTLTISELIEVKKFSFKLIIYKINGKLIRKEDYETSQIGDGDVVHAIHMISGG